MIFGMFMAILDIQIVASSLSEIQAGLSASADEISWVQTSYLIAEVVAIPLSGYMSRLLSTRILFVISAASFTIMSFACAFAWDLNSMIVLRALQGFLGGAMIPTVFATSFTIFPPNRSAGVSVIIGLVATLAPTLGPTLGGYLTESYSWHWLFLINVAPGLLVSIAVWLLMDIDRPNWSLLKSFDWYGLLFMALFLGSLEYVMEEGPRDDWFDDTSIITFTAVTTLGGIAFFWRTLAAGNPIVELRAFGDRNFAIGSLYSFVIGIGMYGAVYVLPLFLARVQNFNSLQIGETMFVTGTFQLLSAPLAGALSRKLDPRVMLAAGLTLFGLGMWQMTYITADWGFWDLFLPQATRGLALMFCIIPVNTIALGTLPPSQLKNASGLYNLMRNLGGAIGLASINTVLTDRAALHWTRIADHINLSLPNVQQYIDNMSARLGSVIGGDADAAAIQRIGAMVAREAGVQAFGDSLLALALVYAFALATIPLIRKPRQALAEAH